MGASFDYYKTHLKELYEKYPNRFIVLKDAEVVADFSDFDEAYEWSVEKLGLGNFLIQECVGSLEEITQVFHSRAVFVL